MFCLGLGGSIRKTALCCRQGGTAGTPGHAGAFYAYELHEHISANYSITKLTFATQFAANDCAPLPPRASRGHQGTDSLKATSSAGRLQDPDSKRKHETTVNSRPQERHRARKGQRNKEATTESPKKQGGHTMSGPRDK